MILNVYRHFYDRKSFWEKLKDARALEFQNLILRGDLNLTMSSNEVWGKNARAHSLAPYFRHMFEQKGPVDVAPIKISPTWRNKRSGDHAVSKRLDKFLVLENLIGINLIIKASVEIGGNSNHNPIVLTINTPIKKPPPPFIRGNFNSKWAS